MSVLTSGAIIYPNSRNALKFAFPFHCKIYKTIKSWSHHLVSEFWCFEDVPHLAFFFKIVLGTSGTEKIILT